jgi:hypothetical protein
MSDDRWLSRGLDPTLFMADMGMSLDWWQERVVMSDKRSIIILCSRQAGKSQSSAVKCLHTATFNPGAQILILAPAERQSKLLLGKIKRMWRRLPEWIRPKAVVWNRTSVEFENGSQIAALPGSDDTVRGFSDVVLMVIDEASRVPDVLYHAARPMLATTNGQLILPSTPFGKRGFFYQSWQSSENNPSWERIGPIPAEDIPRISESFLADERRDLPAAIYRQEYECEFTDQIGAVFSMDLIQATMTDASISPLFSQSSQADPLYDPTLTPLLNLFADLTSARQATTAP